MSYIKVNTDQIKSLENDFCEGLRTVNDEMSNVRNAMDALKENWAGDDASAFMNRWYSMQSKQSSYGKYVQTIIGYSSFLHLARSEYTKAQQNAASAAIRLRG